MKNLMIFIGFLLMAAKGHAQVNLDQPIPVGPNDHVYRSTSDVNGAYLIPTRLISLDDPRVEEVNGEYRVFFNVGMDPGQYDPINAIVSAMTGEKDTPLTLRMMRGWNGKVSDQSLEVDSKFKPTLKSLGDPGALGEPLPYMFSIKKIGPKLGKDSQNVLKYVFHDKIAHHLGSIVYQFDGSYGDQHVLINTAVAIFALNHDPAPAEGSDPVAKAASLATRNYVMMRDKVLGLDAAPGSPAKISLDSETHCWEKPAVGELCLRPQ